MEKILALVNLLLATGPTVFIFIMAVLSLSVAALPLFVVLQTIRAQANKGNDS